MKKERNIQKHPNTKRNHHTSIFEDIILRRNTNLEKEAILGKTSITYRELIKKIECLSTFFHSLGIHKHSIVGICLHCCAEYIYTVFAINKIGGVCVFVNPNTTPREKQYIIEHSEMTFLITKDDIEVDAVRKYPQKSFHNELQAIGPTLQNKTDQKFVHGECMIIYTSGSTGRPRGAVLTNKGILNNVRAVSEYLELSPEDRTIVFTPPGYIYAVSQILTHLWAGGAILPYPQGLRFPYEINYAISKYSLTGIAANPTSYKILTSCEIGRIFSFDCVRYIMSGGQPLSSDLAKTLSKRFRKARVVNMYGCTENSPRISYYWLPKTIPNRKTSWPVGHPVRGTQILITNEQGKSLPQGETSEVCIRGNSLMQYYWKDAKSTQNHYIGRWFKTGDLGFIDTEGALNLVGRIDNIINVGHEKVSPEEVEEVVRSIEEVNDVGVTSVKDELLGNVPIAFVELKKERGEISENKLRLRTREKLSSRKVPHKFVSVESIPKNLYGKTDRIQLKKLANEFNIANGT